jgi:5-methylcytosine-specific restriction enzyme A
MAGGRVDRRGVEQGENGRGLCRWCNLEVPSGRFTFCSQFCVHEWRIRTDPGYLRECTFRRDKGVCAKCSIDTQAAYFELKRSRGPKRQKLLVRWGLKSLGRKSLWDADHVTPVAEGGGECDLQNIRTLCLLCHRVETTLLRERMKLLKAQEQTNPIVGSEDNAKFIS